MPDIKLIKVSAATHKKMATFKKKKGVSLLHIAEAAINEYIDKDKKG